MEEVVGGVRVRAIEVAARRERRSATRTVFCVIETCIFTSAKSEWMLVGPPNCREVEGAQLELNEAVGEALP